ncbi:class II peroxidase, partial [Sphaerobolus stellatus SS14]
CPDGTSAPNGSQQCCPFVELLADIQQNLTGTTACTNLVARNVLRLAFHDAMGASASLTSQGQFGGGGADGSILVFPQETTYIANEGFNLTVFLLQPFLERNPSVSPGDFLQFAAAVGLATCPGAPQVKFLAGRPSPIAAAPDQLIPEPTDSVTTILNRFNDAGGFAPAEVVALMAGHSIALNYHLEVVNLRTPFDSTPDVFDTQFYLDVLLNGTVTPNVTDPTMFSTSPFNGELRLLSDAALARDSRTACTWQGFVNQQTSMQQAFSAAWAKMSVIGQSTQALVDCSSLVPTPPSLSSTQNSATFMGGTTQSNIQQAPACSSAFPS